MRAPRLSIGLGSFLVALALVVAVGIGSAIAAIPNNGTYYACLTKSTGALKVIDYPKVKTCPKGTQLIKWSQQGPAGPQGPQGAQVAGPWTAVGNKPAGFADGVDNEGVTGITLTRVLPPAVVIEGGMFGSASATCPAGSTVTGGGFSSSNVDGTFAVTGSFATPDGWLVEGRNTGSSNVDIQAFAMCLTVQEQ